MTLLHEKTRPPFALRALIEPSEYTAHLLHAPDGRGFPTDVSFSVLGGLHTIRIHRAEGGMGKHNMAGLD